MKLSPKHEAQNTLRRCISAALRNPNATLEFGIVINAQAPRPIARRLPARALASAS
jgi:hypothetical protein